MNREKPMRLVLILLLVTLITTRHYDSLAFELAEHAAVEVDGQIKFPSSRSISYPTDGVALGEGWNSYTDQRSMSICVQFDRKEVGGQTASVETKRIFEKDSLRKELDVTYSVSASADFGDIGGASITTKTNYLNSSKIDQSKLSLLIKGKVRNGSEFVSPPSVGNTIDLTPQAKALLEKQEFDEFLKICGDSFVSSIKRGADMYALYQFRDKTDAEKNQKTVGIFAEGSYLGFGGSASSERRKMREQIASQKISNLRYLHHGHRGLRLPADEPSLLSALSSLGSALEAKDAHPYGITTIRYDSLPTWQVRKLKTGPILREAVYAFLYRLRDLQRVVDNIQEAPEEYLITEPYELASLANLPYLLETKISEASKILEGCELMRDIYNNMEEIGDQKAKCQTTQDDVIFSDYPIRLLLPLPKSEQKYFTPPNELKRIESEIANLNKSIDINESFIQEGEELSQEAETIRLKKKIWKLQSKVNLLKSKDPLYDRAIDRFRFWIEEQDKARKEQGLLLSGLNKSEKMMLKRDIFCQYGIRFDDMLCPKEKISQLVVSSYPVSTSQDLDIQITGEASSDSTVALRSLENLLLEFFQSKSDGRPFYFELLNPQYSFTRDGGNVIFNIVGRARLTNYQNARNQLLQKRVSAPALIN